MENFRTDIDNCFFAGEVLLPDAGAPQLDSHVLFPLYLAGSTKKRQPNIESLFKTCPLNVEIVRKIAAYTGMRYTENADELLHESASPVCYALSSEIRDEFKIPTVKTTFSPVDILDYSYAFLHLPVYDKNHKHFLKTGTLTVQYPRNAAVFWALVEIGRNLRQVHFSQSPVVTSYPEGGNNIVTRKLSERSPGFVLTDKAHAVGQVWINDRQYFDKVPLGAWDFYIGGVFPAREWLRTRHGNMLVDEEISHYQKIITVLSETDRLIRKIDMRKIDRIEP